jgi:hypothetical protein
MTTRDTTFVVEGTAGLIAAPLFLLAFGLFAGPPTPREAVDRIVPYLTDHRSQIFATTVLLGLGACFYVWYLAGLRRFVSPGDDASLGFAALLGGVLAVVLVLVGTCLLAGAALHIPDRPLALLAFDAYNGLITVGGFGFGFSLVVAAVSGRRSGALSARLTVAGLAIGTLQLATIPGLWVDEGFFAPLGAMAVIAFVLLTAWYAAVAWTMTRIRRESE